MTNRYDLFLDALHKSNLSIVQVFLFACFVIVAWRFLDWTPPFLRRPAKYLYLVSILGLFLVTVFLARS